MSSRTWRALCAIGGLSLAILLAAMFVGGWGTYTSCVSPSTRSLAALFEQQIGYQGGGAEDNQPAPSSDATQSKFEYTAAPATPQRTAEAKPDHPPPQKRDEHDKGDLRAQQSMACAAWSMFWIVLLQTIFTIFGVILVWNSLRYTRHAIRQGVRSTVIARKATAAAIESVAITREAMATELRPYLTFSECILERLHTDSPTARVIVKNTGTLPAHVFKCTVEWHSKIDGVRRYAILDFKVNGVIGKDDNITINLYLPLHMLAADGAPRFPVGAKLYLSGRVEYAIGHQEDALAPFAAEFTFSRVGPGTDTMKITGSTIDEIYDAPLREARRADLAAKAEAEEKP